MDRKDPKAVNQFLDLMYEMCEEGSDADELPNSHGEFGHTTTNPIPTHTVFGSRAYLERLRTLEGERVVHSRIGSFSSSVSPYPIDGYSISRKDGSFIATIYLTPYQKRNSAKAPKDFLLEDEGRDIDQGLVTDGSP